MYRENIPDDQFFFFNVELDDTREPVLDVGKYTNSKNTDKIQCCQTTHYFNLMISSIKLMRYVEYDRVFHIDGTHDIVKNPFPLDIFEITDRTRTLHLIAFMMT